MKPSLLPECFQNLFKDLGFTVEEDAIVIGNTRIMSEELGVWILNELVRFTLTADEIDLIYYRYGMGTYSDPHTLKECGEHKSVSDEYARTLINKCLRKLKHPVNIKKLLARVVVE